jgi:hypothetical protein
MTDTFCTFKVAKYQKIYQKSHQKISPIIPASYSVALGATFEMGGKCHVASVVKSQNDASNASSSKSHWQPGWAKRRVKKADQPKKALA